MNNPFLMHPQQLRQCWKDLRTSLDGSVDLKNQLQLISNFWNQAPISKPYLDYLDPEAWPDPWTLLDNKLLDRNSLSLGMFYTIWLSKDCRMANNSVALAMMRQPNISWEGMVCVVNGQWIMGYDTNAVVDLYSIPDLRVMHTYKYDLRKRCIAEINVSSDSLHFA
jgi:hypothetical protein